MLACNSPRDTRRLLEETVLPHRRFVLKGQSLVTLFTILLSNIAKTSVNNKKGKALTDSHKNLISIYFIIPGGRRHRVYLAKEFQETLDIRLGLIILRNFALGKAVPRWGTFAYIAGITPQIIKDITFGQARLAALLDGINRKLEGESL